MWIIAPFSRKVYILVLYTWFDGSIGKGILMCSLSYLFGNNKPKVWSSHLYTGHVSYTREPKDLLLALTSCYSQKLANLYLTTFIRKMASFDLFVQVIPNNHKKGLAHSRPLYWVFHSHGNKQRKVCALHSFARSRTRLPFLTRQSFLLFIHFS